MGTVSVPDDRLQQLAELSSSQEIVPTRVEFVDIAGLVAGASQGEGLGNKFLATRALNRVDLPTLGSPTIPALSMAGI